MWELSSETQSMQRQASLQSIQQQVSGNQVISLQSSQHQTGGNAKSLQVYSLSMLPLLASIFSGVPVLVSSHEHVASQMCVYLGSWVSSPQQLQLRHRVAEPLQGRIG